MTNLDYILLIMRVNAKKKKIAEISNTGKNSPALFFLQILTPAVCGAQKSNHTE